MEGKGESSFVFFEDFGSLIMGASGWQAFNGVTCSLLDATKKKLPSTSDNK